MEVETGAMVPQAKEFQGFRQTSELEEAGKHFLLEPSQEAWPCRLLGFGLVTSRENTFLLLLQNLLRQRWKLKIELESSLWDREQFTLFFDTLVPTSTRWKGRQEYSLPGLLDSSMPSDSSRGLVETQIAGLQPQTFQISRSGWGLRTCILNKFLGDTHAVGPRTHVETHGYRGSKSGAHQKNVNPRKTKKS